MSILHAYRLGKKSSGNDILLRPDGTIVSTGWARTGGSTVHEVLSDDSDSTYVAPAPGSSRLELDFSTAAFTTIESVTPRIRWLGETGFGTYGDQADSFEAFLFETGFTTQDTGVIVAEPSTSGLIVTNSFMTMNTKPSGGPWTQSALNNIQVHIDSGNVGGNIKLYEVYLSVIGT